MNARPTILATALAVLSTAGAAADRPVASAVPVTRSETVTLGEGDLLRGVRGDGPLTVGALRAWLADERNHRELRARLPVGLDAGAADLRGLSTNRLTRAKVELGRQLFFDPRLSADGSVSCASCHDPDHGYAAPTRFGVGVGGQTGSRNSPTIFNRALSDAQFWDGRAASLEEQAVGPMANPVEMGFTHAAVVGTLKRAEGYRVQFEAVFGPSGVTIENAGRAIAAFERAVVTGPSPWDHHQRLAAFERAYAFELSDPAALATEEPALLAEHERLKQAATATPLSESARRGAELFFGDRTGCTQCHAGANLTDERYHNLGVGLEGVDDPSAEADWGRFAETHDDADRGAFKTPTLRNVAQTAPYLHDGSAETLAEVIELYVLGGHENPWLSPLIAPLDLDSSEQADLVAFLEALTGAAPEVETGRLPE